MSKKSKKQTRRKRKLFYVETGMGAGIRSGLDEEQVYNAELKSVGTYNGVFVVREATEEDISMVKSMCGHIPEL